MIIYIEEINLQNTYAVSKFVDHLIDILKTACRKNLLEILNSIHIALLNAGMANRILNIYICFEYNMIK